MIYEFNIIKMDKVKKLIGQMQDRIMKHQNENGFETIYDFLNEDLQELWKQINLNLGSVSISYPSINKIQNYASAMFNRPYEKLDYKMQAFHDGLNRGYKQAIKDINERNSKKNNIN